MTMLCLVTMRCRVVVIGRPGYLIESKKAKIQVRDLSKRSLIPERIQIECFSMQGR